MAKPQSAFVALHSKPSKGKQPEAQPEEVDELEELLTEFFGQINILTTNIKGGVGKSSNAQFLSCMYGMTIVTNDLDYGQGDRVICLKQGSKTLPNELKGKKSIVYDFGAMHGNMDTKLVEAFEESDLVVIPTLLDPMSLQATKETYRLFAEQGKPVFIAFCAVSKAKENKMSRAISELTSELGFFRWIKIPESTLFARLQSDGEDWEERVFNAYADRRLNRSIRHTKEELLKIKNYLDSTQVGQ